MLKRFKNRKTQNPEASGRPIAESLEERILFSADLPWANQLDNLQQPETLVCEQQIDCNDLEKSQSSEESETVIHHVIADSDWLLEHGLDANEVAQSFAEVNVKFSVLDNDDSGIEQLGTLFNQNGNSENIHILANASQQGLFLGNDVLGVDQLLNQASEVSSWRDQLNENANFEIFASHVEAFAESDQFVEILDSLTGAQTKMTAFAGISSVTTQIFEQAGINIQSTSESSEEEFANIELTLELEALQIDVNQIQNNGPSESLLDATSLALVDAEQASLEIVFIDETVENYEQLLFDITHSGDTNRAFEVIVLSNEEDGIQQISDVLAARTDIDAVHIISHGTDGEVRLGDSILNEHTFTQVQDEIALWATAFSENGDLLIYGCNLAATAEGQNLLQQIALASGADVAASDDLTGAASKGGDWELEYNFGDIEAAIAISQTLQEKYIGVLDIDSNLVAQYTFEEGSGTTATDVAPSDSVQD
ncbi:MAG: DUF4347 domain-containing protein, partial [Gammaproteobacteria bacterium]